MRERRERRERREGKKKRGRGGRQSGARGGGEEQGVVERRKGGGQRERNRSQEEENKAARNRRRRLIKRIECRGVLAVTVLLLFAFAIAIFLLVRLVGLARAHPTHKSPFFFDGHPGSGQRAQSPSPIHPCERCYGGVLQAVDRRGSQQRVAMVG